MADDREPIAARHEAVIRRLAAAARDDDRVAAAWLQGSRADGSSDAFSDIDFHLAVSDDAFDSFDKLAFIERAGRVLVHADLFGPNAVACLLEGPVKLDLVVERVSAAPGVERSAAELLVDRAGITLKTGWTPSDSDIARQVDRVIRGMLQGAAWPVRLLRRGQWMTFAHSELALIHDAIVPLMLVQRDRRAFHRNPMTRERLLTEEQQAEVDALANEVFAALVARSLDGTLRAHLRVLQTLGRASREACARFGLEYPEAAEREARAFYEREWPEGTPKE